MFKVSASANGDLTVDLLIPRPRDLTVATIDAAGVSWYRQVLVGADGSVGVQPRGNVVSPTHEISRHCARKTARGLAVSFTLAATGWGGRDDRRPGWMFLLNESTPLWPGEGSTDAHDRRLNISPMYPSAFGRLVWDER